MLFLLLFLQLTFFFLSNVAALNITVQSEEIVGQPSLVLWSREPSDGNGQLIFDLRFVKPGDEDIGLALANIQAPPSTEFGTLQVVFPSAGSYLLVAVTGPGYTRIGQSGQVNAFQVPTTSIPTSTSQPVSSTTSSVKPSSTSFSATSSAKPSSTSPSATSSAKPTTIPSGTNRKKNLGAIIGGTLGGVAFLGLFAALGIMFLRRRPTEDDKRNRRWTFHRDKMILPPVLDIRRTSPMNTQFLSSGDIEQQVGLPHEDITTIPTSPVVMMASPSGSRPLLKSPHRPLPLTPPVPLNPHQEDLMVQMQQIRSQMTELKKNAGPTQHIILDDLQKQLNWLKSQVEKSSLS